MAIPFNDNIESRTPKATDSRYGKVVIGRTVPFDTVAEALNSVTIYRYEGLILPVRRSLNKIDLYWFEGGVADSNFVLFNTQVDLSDYYTKVQVDGLLSPITTSITSIQGEVSSLDTFISSVDTDLTTHKNRADNPHAVTKTQIGLANVDNTSDLSKPISTAAQSALDLKAPINNPVFTGTVGGINKGMVGLPNVDNTSDLSKPISTLTQAALDLKAPINSPAFTGTVTGITKAMVGLSNVDNTTDANKPVSTLQQAAINLKANINSPALTGTPTVPTAASGTNTLQIASTAFVQTAISEAVPVTTPDATTSVKGKVKLAGDLAGTADVPTVPGLALKANINSPTFTGTVGGITKFMVGLGNVDNTSDLGKPISTATQTALDLKATPTDIDTALDASQIFFDGDTFEGKNFPVPTGGEPAVGTEENPIKSKGSTVIEVANVVENGNLNPVSSDAVYDSQITQTLLITGGSSYTIADLYELFTNGGLAPEDPPTDFVVDDVADTAGFTFADPGDALSDYEFKIVDAAITTVTVNPIPVGNINAAIGTVKIRKKGQSGVSSPSPWIVNPTAYTATSGDGDYMAGYVPIDLLAAGNIKNGNEFTTELDGVYTQSADGNLNVTIPYHMPNGARVAYKVLEVGLDTGTQMGLSGSFGLSTIRGTAQYEDEIYRKYFDEDIIEGVTIAVGDHIILEFIDPNLGVGDDNAVRQLKLYKTSDGGENIIEIPFDPILNFVNGYEGYASFLILRDTQIGYPQQLGLILDTEAGV